MASLLGTGVKNGNFRRQVFSEVALLDGEDSDAFERLHESLVRVFQPADTLETELVEVAALTQWRLKRLHKFEAGAVGLWLDAGKIQYRQLDELSRCEARLTRNLLNTLALLRAAQRQHQFEAAQ